MNVEVFTGVGPDFQLLTTVEFHCPCCGRKVRVPTEMMLNRVADKQNEYLVAENKKLREIIELGQQVQPIKRMADKL